MKTTIKEFLKQVKDLKIVERDDLNRFLKTWPDQHPDQDVGVIARSLIDREFLTEYQANVLMRGKGHLLCMKNYLIREQIEKGGMGTVFLARHRTMQRDVAMKVLSKKNTQNSTAVRRFFQEAQTAAKLFHPNIAAAFDADQDHGHWFLVSEYVDGDDFQKLVEKNGPLFPSVAIDLILQAAKGLEFAHEAGVTHRDIKPSNLMLNREGKVKLLDLGLARLDEEADQTRLTCADVVMGTPHYMAPEQADEIDGADARSDIYSLGCTLFFLLTGEPPYNVKTVVRALIAHRDRPIPDLRDYRDDTTRELQSVVERMMAKDPNDRYQKVSEVIEDLDLMKAGEHPTRALTEKPLSSLSGLKRFAETVNQYDAGLSDEYYLDDEESHTSLPTRHIAAVQNTTSVDRLPTESGPGINKPHTSAWSQSAIGRIASDLTSIMSFLKRGK